MNKIAPLAGIMPNNKPITTKTAKLIAKKAIRMAELKAKIKSGQYTTSEYLEYVAMKSIDIFDSLTSDTFALRVK